MAKKKVDIIGSMVDSILIQGLPAGLRTEIDKVIARGGDGKKIAELAKQTAGETSPIYLGVQAYIESKRKP